MDFSRLRDSNFARNISTEFIASMVTRLIIIIFSFVVYFKQKKYSYKEKPKGIVNLAEIIVDFGDKQVNELRGHPKYFSNFGGYIIPLAAYIFIGFVVGRTGFPNLIVLGPASEGYLRNETNQFSQITPPFTNLAFTLSIGLLTVVIIELTKLRSEKWNYYRQFIFTFPPLLPLATNLVPMISFGRRLFGNAFAGFCIETLLYYAFNSIGHSFGLVLAPVFRPFIHAYFDAWGGIVQTMVFVRITRRNIAQQAPENEAVEEQAKARTLKAHR